MTEARPSQSARSKNNPLVLVLSLSLIFGMAVAFGVFLLWRANPAAWQFPQPLFFAGIVVCPPFVLSLAAAGAGDSALAQVLLVGTIIFANGFLYAGVAAGIYAIVTTLMKKRRRSW